MEVVAFILIGISCLAILLTLIVFFLNIVGKLKSKTESDGKKSFLWIFPFIFLICLLFGLIVGVLLTKVDMIEESMDDIINETNSILESARQRYSEVSLFKLDESTKNIDLNFFLLIHHLEKNIEFEPVRTNGRSFEQNSEVAFSGMEYSQTKIEELLAKILTGCGVDTDVEKDEILKQISIVRKLERPISKTTSHIESRFRNVGNDLISIVEEHQKMDVGKGHIENNLSTMQKFLDHFQRNINNTYTTREKWIQKMIKVSPNKQFIVKIVVTVTCVILMLFSLMTCIDLIDPKYLNRKLPPFPQRTLSLTYITSILVINISIISIGLASGLIAKFDCPLNSVNFDLSNFTTPFYGIEPFSICDTSDSMFFAGSGIEDLIESDNITQSLKIDEIRKKLWVLVSNSIEKIVILDTLSKEVEALDKSLKKLNEKCLDGSQKNHLSHYKSSLKALLDESEKFKNLVEPYNKNVEKLDTFLKALLDEAYTEVVKSLNGSISDIQQKMSAADFSCSPIIASYSNTAQLICKQVDMPLFPFWIYLIFTILALMAFLILQTVSNVNLKKVKKDKKADGKQSKLKSTSKSHTQTQTQTQTTTQSPVSK